jgi:hypothetical protein
MSPFVPKIADRTATIGTFGDSRCNGEGLLGEEGTKRASGRKRWRRAATSGSLGRLSVRRPPGLRLQHMHNPPVAEILQPFSPKEVG